MKVLWILLALLLSYIVLDAGVACVRGRTLETVVGNLLLMWVSGWYAALIWRRLLPRRSAPAAAPAAD
ncbi:hypothetical protein ACIQU5_08385 [Streptomyces sp. NPDC090306]|uniref:hypothetical protein n=1 Tax=unclassified Streptomyces TaxID=2593676 RepID=UPI0036E94931